MQHHTKNTCVTWSVYFYYRLFDSCRLHEVRWKHYKYWLTKGSTHLNDAVVTCTMQSLTSPKQDHQEKQSNLSQASSKDCLSCRIWGGIVHLGIAGFVGSHVHQMPGRFSKAFVGLFSFGEKLRLFLHSIHPALAKTLILTLTSL